MLRRLISFQLRRRGLRWCSGRGGRSAGPDSEQSQSVADLNEEMERSRRVQEAMKAMLAEINAFQETVFAQPETDFLLRHMHVKDALAVACYFKLGFMTNAQNPRLASEIVRRVRAFEPVTRARPRAS